MLTEYAVFCRRKPICSAMVMNRLLKISSMHRIGLGADRACAAAAAATRVSTRCSCAVDSACQPGSTTVVAFFSAMIAGPSMRVAGAQRVAQVQRRVVPRAARVHAYDRLRTKRVVCRARRQVAAHRRAHRQCADGLDGAASDDERRVRHQERIALAICRFERGAHLRRALPELDDQRRIGAVDNADAHAARS